MECLHCKAPIPDDSRYCGQCGAEMSTTLNETVWKRGVRDRQAIEIEITEAVLERLVKWSKWVVGLAVLIFAGILGWSFHDVRSAVGSGKSQIEAAVGEGRNEINSAKQGIPKLKADLDQLQIDADKYQQVNKQIAILQKQLTNVHDQVINLSTKDIVAKSISTAPGPGSGIISFGSNLGCPARLKDSKLGLCAQESPPSVYQVTDTGNVRPVGSLSSIGFQDTSTGKKPDCTAAIRGTLYVEKGTGTTADQPFLCLRNPYGTYIWAQLRATP